MSIKNPCTSCVYNALIETPLYKYEGTDLEKEVGFITEKFCKKLMLRCKAARDPIQGPCGEDGKYFEEI
jgi:hypothetical protein